jgi:pimeloyl-ACP methyl ester carboxylesterase
MRTVRTVLRILTGSALVALAVGVVPTATATSDTCTTGAATIPIGLMSTATMAGTLCVPAGGSDTVVVMVPGATYSSTYWEFPYEPETYSQARAVRAAGHATYVVDRIGTGASSRPLSTLVTVQKQAQAVAASIDHLRAGAIGGTSFDTVVLMGHSLGSVISIETAIAYGHVDGLVITGITHAVNYVEALTLLGNMHPAIVDPAFAGGAIDPLYLTTIPGTRASAFHSGSDPVAEVVAVDEATKSVFAPGEATGLADIILSKTLSVTAPVMVAMGGEDRLMCGLLEDVCESSASLHEAEAPHYSNAASLTAHVTPISGHDLTLARNTRIYQDAVNDWIDMLE